MIRMFEFAGTPRAMGEAFGESCKAEVRALYRARIANAISQAKDYGGRVVGEAEVVAAAAKCLAVAMAYDPDGSAELAGMADAAGLSHAELYAMNALTDLRDYLAYRDEGCSSFLIQRDRTAAGEVACGQTWDLATDNMPFVVAVHRKPANAPETWCLTTVGCLCLIGMNGEGIAIGTTNLRTTDARIGVCYLSMVHKALAARRLEDAKSAIADAPRGGGHYYYLADRKGQAAWIECAATVHHAEVLESGFHVHCNHVLAPENLPLEAKGPRTSSFCRLERLGASIASAPVGSIDDAALRRFLSDHENGKDAICRHDLDGVSSNGAVIMWPESGRISFCQGTPCNARWRTLD